MSSYVEFEVPVIRKKKSVNGDKSLWMAIKVNGKDVKEVLFTCKIILYKFKLYNFCYDKDNYLNFSAFVYFFTKENAYKVSIK